MLVFLRTLGFSALLFPLVILSIPRASHCHVAMCSKIYVSSLTWCLSSSPGCSAIKYSLVPGYLTGNSNSICRKLSSPSLPVFPSANETWKAFSSTSPLCPIICQYYQFAQEMAVELMFVPLVIVYCQKLRPGHHRQLLPRLLRGQFTCHISRNSLILCCCWSLYLPGSHSLVNMSWSFDKV